MVNPVTYPVLRRGGTGPESQGGTGGGDFLPATKRLYFDPAYVDSDESGAISDPFTTWAACMAGVVALPNGSCEILFSGIPTIVGVDFVPLADDFSIVIQGVVARTDSSYLSGNTKILSADDATLTFRDIRLELLTLSGGSHALEFDNCIIDDITALSTYSGLVTSRFSNIGITAALPAADWRVIGGNIQDADGASFDISDALIGSATLSGAALLRCSGNRVFLKDCTFAPGSEVQFLTSGELWMDDVSYRSFNDESVVLTNGTIVQYGGVGSGVTSFNARTGAVVPDNTDYVASLIGNDSTVPGTFVNIALNNVKDIASIDVATTGNVALTGTPANIDTGVALVNGVTTIFVWKNTTQSQNGVYLYNSGGAWTRAPGWTASVNFRPAQPFQITGGALYGGRTAHLKNAVSPTIGVDQIIFNMEMAMETPTAESQSFFYETTTNTMLPSGPITGKLTDADASLAVGTAYHYLLDVVTTVTRTLTLSNTGAAAPDTITLEITRTLAFPIQINNALGALFTIPAGSKYLLSFQFSGGQWGGPNGLQKMTSNLP